MSNSVVDAIVVAQGSTMENCGLPENFPVGMKVLLVDDDLTCLAVVKRMLLNCQYTVTTCSRATEALSLLREDNNAFDLIVSDVHMPDMDGFRLLELVGLEMDLPVIMMSADTRFNIVMKGIKHGACDFLFKPVRLSELQNIWQHVVRRKWHDNKVTEHSASMEETDCNRPITNDGSDGSSRSQKKKRDSKEEDDGELDTADPSSTKKARVVWSVELHQQFVNAVNQLGIDKAVPKRILDLMNVPGLTRENVASHLQKFRLYLKRLSAAAQHNNFYGVPTNVRTGQLSNHDLNALTMAAQVPSQTLVALQDELLGRPSHSFAAIPALNKPILVQTTVQGTKTESGIAFGSQSPSSSFQVWPSNYLSNVDSSSSIGGLSTSQNHDMLKLRSLQQQSHSLLSESHTANVHPSCLVAPSRSSEKHQVQAGTALLNQGSHLLPSQSSSNFQAAESFMTVNHNSGASLSSHSMQTGNKHVVLNEGSVILPSHSVTGISARNSPGILNKSSVVIPSQPLTSFQVTSNHHLVNQNSVRAPSELSGSATFPVEINASQSSSNRNNSSSVIDYSHLSSQLNNIDQRTSMGQVFEGGYNNATVVNSYSAPGLTPLSSCTGVWRVHGADGSIAHPDGSSPNSRNIQATGRFGGSSLMLPDQGHARNLGFVGTGTALPSRFVADDIEYPTSNFSHITSTGDDSFLLNQDPFGFNGAIQGGRCATSFK